MPAVTARILAPDNVYIGRSQLAAGTVTVSLPQITVNSLVFMSGNDANATGAMRAVITGGTGFVITSSVGGDTGFVAWMVMVNQQAT